MILITLDSDMHLIFPDTIGAESNIEVTKSYRRSLPDPTQTFLIFSSPPQLEAQLTIALRLTSGTGYEKKKITHKRRILRINTMGNIWRKVGRIRLLIRINAY